MLDEAVVEHTGAKHFIGEIEAIEPGEDLYDARIRVLSEQIKHHVEEEELFPEEWLEEYEDLENEVGKGELAAKICQALKVHTQIESPQPGSAPAPPPAERDQDGTGRYRARRNGRDPERDYGARPKPGAAR